MKKNHFIGALFLAFMITAFSAHSVETSPKQTATAGEFPMAVAGEPRFEFPPVVEGSVVTHEFVIENKGNAPLAIEKVRTGCGCTTASYSKIVQPGKQGTVIIKGDTSGYGGKLFRKTIKVYTNDPKNPVLSLFINGKVDYFARIQPNRIMLKGDAGDRIESVVTITPSDKYPFTIKGSTSRNLDGKVAFDLKKENAKYLLKIKNLVGEAGRYYGAIALKTDSSIKPEIVLHVYGEIHPGE